ncbi:uncharacterized protein LOC135207029 [Macrobrachium nipponense]|uniref:uncharacterized protein LOC135207029 n=1 Tax=Macrobrachium nipponense TaxID=159736 RepID=UPI0030C8713B
MGRGTHYWLMFTLLTIFLEKGTTSIRITKVHVPNFLEAGSAGDLDCTWEEENDHMYSIKWYQAAHEFYRYTPTARDPIQIFDPPTLDVDTEKSWGGSVRIANVTLGAAGPFHCEVSADGPTFHTASDHAMLNVIDLPDGSPTIRGVRAQYIPGDWVDITCISRRSKPPPRLSFTINDKPVIASWIEPQINQLDSDGLTTSSLQMRFSLSPRLLQREGYARVRCKAQIGRIYEDSVEDILSTTPPFQASVLDGGRASGCSPRGCQFCRLLLCFLVVSPLGPYLL